MRVSVAGVKSKVSQLIKSVEGGVPVVDLVRTKMSGKQKPRFGTVRGRIKINDPDWWKPMSPEEAEAFIGGRR